MGQVVGGPMIFWKLPDSVPIELHLRISASWGSAIYCGVGTQKLGRVLFWEPEERLSVLACAWCLVRKLVFERLEPVSPNKNEPIL